MSFANLFKSTINNVTLQFWTHEEKEALLKIIHEIYTCDHEFSPEEENDFISKLNMLNVDYELIKTISVEVIGICFFSGRHDTSFSSFRESFLPLRRGAQIRIIYSKI